MLGQPLWPLRIADAYRANGPKGPATIYVIHANARANPQVRDQIIAGTRAAAALPEHKHLVRTLAAGLTGDILWIATEEVDGSLVRDMLDQEEAGRHEPASACAAPATSSPASPPRSPTSRTARCRRSRSSSTAPAASA